MTVDLEELREFLALKIEELERQKKKLEQDLKHVEAVQRLTRKKVEDDVWPTSIKQA